MELVPEAFTYHLEGKWILTKAPLACRQSMLEEVYIEITSEVTFIGITRDYIYGKLVHIINSDGRSGTLRLIHRGWTTFNPSKWTDYQLIIEDKIINDFVEALVQTEFNYEFSHNELLIHFGGGKYY